MKYILNTLLVFLLGLSLIGSTLAQDNGYAISMEALKEDLDVYRAIRVELQTLLSNNDSFLFLKPIPMDSFSPLSKYIDIAYMMSKKDLEDSIGIAVMDYCLENGVDPSSKKALEFGRLIYVTVLDADRKNRMEYNILYRKIADKEEQCRNQILSRQQEKEMAEQSRAENRAQENPSNEFISDMNALTGRYSCRYWKISCDYMPDQDLTKQWEIDEQKRVSKSFEEDCAKTINKVFNDESDFKVTANGRNLDISFSKFLSANSGISGGSKIPFNGNTVTWYKKIGKSRSDIFYKKGTITFSSENGKIMMKGTCEIFNYSKLDYRNFKILYGFEGYKIK